MAVHKEQQSEVLHEYEEFLIGSRFCILKIMDPLNKRLDQRHSHATKDVHGTVGIYNEDGLHSVGETLLWNETLLSGTSLKLFFWVLQEHALKFESSKIPTRS